MDKRYWKLFRAFPVTPLPENLIKNDFETSSCMIIVDNTIIFATTRKYLASVSIQLQYQQAVAFVFLEYRLAAVTG